MTPITAREFAAELVNATDFGEDIPRGVLLRMCRDFGFEFETCGDCGRVEGMHAASCASAPRCETCGTWPCSCDDYEGGGL